MGTILKITVVMATLTQNLSMKGDSVDSRSALFSLKWFEVYRRHFCVVHSERIANNRVFVGIIIQLW